MTLASTSDAFASDTIRRVQKPRPALVGALQPRTGSLSMMGPVASSAAIFGAANGLGLGISALYPQGLLLTKQRAPLSSVWISRLVVGALVGAVLGPPATGALLDASPSFFFWAAAFVVFGGTIAFGIVAAMPQYAPPSAPPLRVVSESADAHLTDEQL